MSSLKEFLQTSVHPKGYKPKADWRDDFLIETEEQFKELLQRLLQFRTIPRSFTFVLLN